jgi:uncharacterized protein YndB with AHSA1/START domain
MATGTAGSHRAAPDGIDAALFDAAGRDLRGFVKTRVIRATPRAIFDAWATREGWMAVMSGQGDRPGLTANIELAIGGRYEWLFDGVTGSNGCQVLSYIPDRMLSFTWNAPPTIPEVRERRSWVVVEIDPTDASTEEAPECEVTVTHLGFGQGEAWDKTYAYFDAAWPRVLAAVDAAVGAGDAERTDELTD